MTSSIRSPFESRFASVCEPILGMLSTAFAVAFAAALGCSISVCSGQELQRSDVFDKDNLVAWCIVPFDSEDRTPEARAEMLKRLGISKLAYDYRPRHRSQFQNEISSMKKAGIEIVAWWFPTTLNEEAREILDLFRVNDIHPQLWVMGGGAIELAGQAEEEFIRSEVARLETIADAAAEVGCEVALYNHGGWFGEPQNQLKLIKRLQRPNVGVVYNLHHAHHEIDRIEQTLESLLPHLLAMNLNGMRRDGDRLGFKIMPIGAGELDQKIVKAILSSGYDGPIGILNHTQNDAEARLADNLSGLQYVLESIAGVETSMPVWTTFDGLPDRDEGIVNRIIEESDHRGDFGRGLRVFINQRVACASCHAISNEGTDLQLDATESLASGLGTASKIGPNLGSLATRRSAAQILHSLLWPNDSIEPHFQLRQVLTEDGELHKGYVTERAEEWSIREPASNRIVHVGADAVLESTDLPSSMPEGLVNALSYDELLDLLAFLRQLGPDAPMPLESISNVVAHAADHSVAEFPAAKEPRIPSWHPYADAHINRDRMYDYYAKQADYFSSNDRDSLILPEFPGLDGDEYGHWGNQNEETWEDNSWNQMDLGSVQTNTYIQNGQAYGRAIAIRVGTASADQPNQLNKTPDGIRPSVAACYDSDSLQYIDAWSGDFLSYSHVRAGFLDGMASSGESIELPEQFDWPPNAVYRGRLRYGHQTIFVVSADGKLYLDWLTWDAGVFSRHVAPAGEHPMRHALRGGPSLWPKALKTSIRSSTESGIEFPYVIDTVELPFDNAWHTGFYVGDLDFFSNGNLAVSTMRGDVWIASDLSIPSENASWRRFASGLYQPLGLKVVDDEIYVLGRNEITRLIDHNQDGEADEYQTLSRAMITSTSGHDFICGLETDSEGNWYTASGNEGLLKISRDGQSKQILATGFRNPDGLGVFEDQFITVPCSEGSWTPASMVCAIGFGDTSQPFFGYGGPTIEKPPTPAMLYLPRGVDNSSGAQVSVQSDRWGPYGNHPVHLSYGTGTMMPLLVDEINGVYQAAAVSMPGGFRSGAHRGAVSPTDHQLYVGGMGGWGTYTPDPGCIERVRYVQELDTMPNPTGYHVHQNGVFLSFDRALTPVEATWYATPENHFAQAWNYRYSGNYGSAEYSIAHGGVRGHDRLAINQCVIGTDRQSLFLEIPDLQLCNQLHLRLSRSTSDAIDLYCTCNAMDEPYTDFSEYRESGKRLMPHPIQRDILLAQRAKPNPFTEPIEGAREVEILAGSNLSFTVREFRVQPKEPIHLTFYNPDAVPHNWALIERDSLDAVGELANHLIGAPEAFVDQYIPSSDAVICYTDIVESKQGFEIYFRAPEVPGRYPYLCTFPGHWMVMNGVMVVEEE